jgi:hypothetical protein
MVIGRRSKHDRLMLMVPSPRALVHGKSEYVNLQLFSLELPVEPSDREELSRKQEDFFLDLRFLADANRMTRLRAYPPAIFRFFSLCGRVRSTCVQAIRSKQSRDDGTAIPLFTEAAHSGNVDVMNEIGGLLANLCVFTTATIWFRRAIRCGSIAAVFHLAKVSYDMTDFLTALSLFACHFRATRSLLTAIEIAKTLSKLELVTQSTRWFRFCAASGMPVAVRELTRILNSQPHAVSSFIQWSLVTKRYEIPDKTYSFSDLLFATPKRDESLPSLSALHRQAAAPVADIVPTQQSSSYAPVMGHRLSIFHPFPVMTGQTKSQKFLIILEYASESYEKRNLRVCETAIKGLRLKDPVFPYDCALWRFKCASERSEDLVACGFISCVLCDFEFGLSLFKKAAAAGSETGALMCGIILYYGWSVERNVAQGLFCMNRCAMDPIALAHCGLCAGDGPDWSMRAAEIIGDEARDFLYEKIGDVFYDGIKIPKNNQAAIAWYVMQLEKSQLKGHDTKALVMKLSRIVHEQNSAL